PTCRAARKLQAKSCARARFDGLWPPWWAACAPASSFFPRYSPSAEARSARDARIVPFGCDAIAPTPHKPHHAEQVHHPRAKSTEKAVFRDAVAAFAIGDGLLTHIPAGPLDQRGKKPVHRCEIGQVLESAAADQFETATCVRGVIAQAETPNSVRNARLQPFEPAVIAAGASPADNAKGGVRVRCGDHVPDTARVGRIVLAVAIEKLYPFAARASQAREQRGGFASAFDVRQHDHAVRRCTGGRKFGSRCVAGTIVDADDLVVDALERRMHFIEQGRDIPSLIVEWDEDAEGAAR